MLGAEAMLVPGASALAALHAAELPQKDDLCGSFCTLLALRLAGEEVADQDTVALAAGGTISATGHHESLPAGEPGRRDYRASLPVLDGERSGTAAAGLVRAIPELSDGRQAAVALRGPWTAATVDALLDAVCAEPQAALVLNVATRFFWGSHPTTAQLLAYLGSGDATAGPAPDWDVGHFVGCLGVLRGVRGALVAIADTYPALGLRGVHLQPRERLAAALARQGMTAGGALVVVPAARRDAVAGALASAGLAPGVWDNGSVDARGAG